MGSLIFPPYLQEGDRVIILSPSSKIDKSFLKGAYKRLKSWGLEVVFAKHAGSSNGTYAGSIRQRLEDLQEAMDDEEAKVIFCSRGGYGAVHLIGKLDFTKFRQHPKWLIGFSDITALHNLFQQNGFASLHAPMARHLTVEPEDDFCTQALKDVLFGQALGGTEAFSYVCPGHKLNHKRKGKGVLRGGNLSVFYGLRGTPYDIPAEGTILFIEDVGERPHAVERMMYNLKLGGILDKLSGLIIGQFTEYEENKSLGKDLYGALADLVKEYDYPICFDFPVGHVSMNVPLINGAAVTLKVGKKEVKLSFNTEREWNYTFIPLLLLLIVAIVACSNNSSKSAADNDSEGDATKATVQVPQFSADSAYQYIQTQADFGPRVPNTAAHKACGEFLAKKLEEFGAKVYNQHADLVAYDNTILKARNVIGAYNPESKRRVLLCAHWDSRPYADQDADKTKHHSPILGVNDGASGVGVLLEVARQLQQQAPAIGIDIIFFDAEDYGIPYFYQGAYKNDTWCLGSQYWGRVPHVDGYNARYGILLDMVGGKNATFYKEQFSQRTAGKYVNKIWNTAHRLGFGNFFPKEKGTEVTDDHMYVYNLRQIPCVDIINYDPNCDTGFGDFWHTIDDTMDIIDKGTLNAVGQTLLEVIYNEK